MFYSARRVRAFPRWEFAVDPRDGRRKVKVTITMREPNSEGGLVVRDYEIEVPREVLAATTKRSTSGRRP